MYGVFIADKYAWKLHAVYRNKSDAFQEAKYIAEMLGLRSAVFFKASA